jgi:hypothetical protein
VRGEDSWIRAIWAGKPFVWQPYRQEDAVHISKLQAFIEVFTTDAPIHVHSLMQASHLAWSENAELSCDHANNLATKISYPQLWQHLIDQLPAIQAYNATQAATLACQADLATKLVTFSENLIRTKV